eukprot:Sspe_Gene.106108::Locus_83309_Transcript_1_1_Confidence_1.000_Length_692::g.106108::m.106108
MSDPVTTLHISGLPPDFRTRELYLLYRKQPGFKVGFVKYGEGKLALAFVEFDTVENAKAALKATDGLAVDPAVRDQKIHVHIASSNMKKRPQTTVGSNAGGAQAAPSMLPMTQQYPPYMMPQQSMVRPPPQPCTTLYISNVDSKITQEVLSTLLSRYPGFNRVSLKNGRAWADFSQVVHAMQAKTSLENWAPEPGMAPLKVTWAKSETK